MKKKRKTRINKEDYEKKLARDISIKEGSFAAVQSSVGDNYIAPFAIAINSSNSQVAMLTSIPGLLGPLSQLIGSRLIEKYSRKKILLFSILLHALIWIPIIAIAFLFWKGIWTGFLPIMLLVFFSIYAIFSNLAGPAWFSWMGDIVPEEERGRYFSIRNKIIAIITIICTISAAYFLDIFKKNNFVLLGFSALFFIAMCARLASRNMFKYQYEPKIKFQEGYYFSFWQFIKKAWNNNFGRFVFFRTFLSFSVAIASPFFAVYMLKDLNFNYVSFMAVSLAPTFYSLFTMPFWGKFSDKYGNYEVMKITSVFIALIPILWLFSKSVVYFILVTELVSGIGWAGFNLAAGNYIYDCVTPQKRGLAVSYYNILNGLGVFIGASLGGYIATHYTINFMNIFLLLFLISGIMRFLSAKFMLTKIKEVRKVKKFKRKITIKEIFFKTSKRFNEHHEIIMSHIERWKNR